MKLFLIASASAFSDNRVARDVEERGVREFRYFMAHYAGLGLWKANEYDYAKFFDYGCHCRFLENKGKGRPVDALDAVCKAHNQCLRCARQEYGENCINSISDRYRYSWNDENGPASYGTKENPNLSLEPVCRDQANTCKRALCECDRVFAKAHAELSNLYNYQYSGDFDQTDPNSCPTSSGSADMQCCNNADKSTSFKLYNADKMQCCADGSLQELGQFC